MPTDAYADLCTCNLCANKGSKELGYQGQISNYVWEYVNEVAKALYLSHPNKKVLCFAYGTYLLPPTNIAQLSPNIIVGICRWRTDLLDPKKKELYTRITREWQAKANQNPVFIWDYYLHAKPSNGMSHLPVYFPHLIAEDIKSMKGRSLGEFVEIYREHTNFDLKLDDLAVSHVNIALTAALYWNPDLNVDEWLRNYCTQMYGALGPEMLDFILQSEQSWKGGEVAHLYKKLEQILAKATKGTPAHQRIKLILDALTTKNKFNEN